MKRLSLLLICCAAAPLWGQNTSIGPKVGLNYAHLAGFKEGGYKLGPVVGATFNYAMSEFLSIGADLQYSGQGSLVKSPDKTRYGMHYVQLPVYGKFYFGNDYRMRYYTLGGLNMGLLAAAKKKTETAKTNLMPVARKGDIGLVVGFGGIANLNKGRFFHADIRYSYGFVNVAKPEWDSRKFHNSVFSINMAITFPFKNDEVACPAFWDRDKNDYFDKNGDMKENPNKGGERVKVDSNGRVKKVTPKNMRDKRYKTKVKTIIDGDTPRNSGRRSKIKTVIE